MTEEPARIPDAGLLCAAHERHLLAPLDEAIRLRGYASAWLSGHDAVGADLDGDGATSPACVIVAWTRASVADRRVVALARAAYVRGVLVQVVREDCAIPPFFGRQQRTLPADWDGRNPDRRIAQVMETIAGFAERARHHQAELEAKAEARRLRAVEAKATRRTAMKVWAGIAATLGAAAGGGYLWLEWRDLFTSSRVTDAGLRSGIRAFDCIATIVPPSGELVTAAEFSPTGGQFMFVCNSDLYIAEMRAGYPVKAVPKVVGVTACAYAPDGTRIAIGGGFENAGAVHKPVPNIGIPGAYTVEPNAKNMHFLRLLDGNGRLLWKIPGHEGIVNSVRFSRDGLMLVTGSEDQSVRVWQAGSGEQVASWKGDRTVDEVDFCADGRTVAIGQEFGSQGLILWDFVSGRIDTIKRDYTDHVHFSPDGTRVAAAGDWTRPIDIYDRVHRNRTISVPAMAYTDFAFSPDGRRILCADLDGVVALWDAMTGELLGTLKDHPKEVRSVAFAPDGRLFLTAGGALRETIRLWRIVTD